MVRNVIRKSLPSQKRVSFHKEIDTGKNKFEKSGTRTAKSLIKHEKMH
jgi:hypothetical protein